MSLTCLPLGSICLVCKHADRLTVSCSAALVFEGIGFFDIGVAVFLRRFDYLVNHLRPLSASAAQMSRSETVSWLQTLIQPVRRDE